MSARRLRAGAGVATARPYVSRLLGLVVLALTGCASPSVERWPAEHAHLVPDAPGAPALTYTLGDETRPILAAPTEARLQLTVPPGAGETFTFPLPATVAANDVIVTGVYQRHKRTFPLTPARLGVGDGPSGARQATMELPVLARGPGPATTLALILTTPPAGDVTEAGVDGIAVPADAQLHLGYALSEAAGAAESAPVALEVLAADGSGERVLWSTVLDPGVITARRWKDVAIGLESLAGREVSLRFRARAAGAGRPALFALWADPTITAPAPRPATRRNVVLISLDTLRADRVGVYGAYRPTTPAIDRMAAASVVFGSAWALWPETSGSHMSLFTSLYPSEHGVTSFITAPPASIELLAERLRRHGYLTAAFTEDGGVWAHAGFARGMSTYAERRSVDFVYRGEAAATFRNATRWIETHAQRTFFLFVHTYQVHAPYNPPREYRTLFADIPGREAPGHVLNALAYDQETRFTDDQVGPFLATLERLDLAARTIVVLTSDHGEEFGEHGGMGHGKTLYREVLQVPLMVWAPGLLRPARIDAPVSLLDVAPTLLELLDIPADPGHRGMSLVGLARGGTPSTARPIFGEVDRVDQIARQTIRAISVRQEGRTAITNLEGGVTRCYAADDPAETTPTDSCPDLAALIAEHRADMHPAGAAPAPPADPRLIEKMRALGYVE